MTRLIGRVHDKYLYKTKIDFIMGSYLSRRETRMRKTPPENIASCGSTSQRSRRRPARECCFTDCFVYTAAPSADPLPRVSWSKAHIYNEDIPNSERDAADPECRRERFAKVASSAAQHSQRHSYIVEQWVIIVSTIYYYQTNDQILIETVYTM